MSKSEEVAMFFEKARARQGQKLDVALISAALIVDELRACAEQWEAALARPRDVKTGRNDEDAN